MRPLWLVVLAACGGGGATPKQDASPGSDAPPDAPLYPACTKFATSPVSVPAHVVGAVVGADLEAPATCASVDAPYGVESGGPDSVVELTGLVAGSAYVVHLTSADDLAFYVVTGCSSPTGPSSNECLLFEDASVERDEIGSFVASGPSAYVVVDTFETTPPSDPSFTLDVYREMCDGPGQCGAGTPACVDGLCVACATNFDCASASAPVCDGAHTCQAGTSACLSDDPAEPADDGPAGATVLVPDGTGYATHSGQICSNPSTEADYLAFDVTAVGDTWNLGLAWQGGRILRLELYDAQGARIGLSYWEQPQHARLTYLAPGRYYSVVTEAEPSGDSSPVNYTLTAQRTAGSGCTTSADCAAEYRNQLYRGECVAGSCVHYASDGQTASLGACDRVADCASGLSCASFFFVANADTRDVCAPICGTDTDCAPLGPDYVCTTYLAQNFCVQKCTSTAQCPVSAETQPSSGPWYHLACDVPSGRCLP